MKRLSIEAFEDRSHPEGGHAVVRLCGLDRVPEPATFRLKIIDALEDDAFERLSRGDLVPESVRATPDGVELVVGPKVTGCPLLLPGTAVEITVPAVDASGGFLWPAIQPADPKHRRSSVFRRTPKPVAASASASAPNSTIVVPAAIAAAARNAMTATSDAAANSAEGTDRTPWIGLAAAPPTGADHASGQRGGASITWQPHGTSLLRRLWPRRPVRYAAGLAPKPRAVSWPAFVAAVAGAVLAVEVAIGTVIGARPLLFPRFSAEAGGPSSGAADLSEALMQSWMRAGAVSPNGRSVAGVTPTIAQRRAERHLAAGPEHDTAEGIFWLKHYLAATAGDSPTVRALTGLGRAHAEPSDGQPDYGLAHRIWEVSAALGDPSAMCRLGNSHAEGHGTTADPVLARHWHERARRAGGCPRDLAKGPADDR